MHADDAMAIFVALQSPEVEVIGLTTIYGNVYTTLATRNALHLVHLLPVCVLFCVLYVDLHLLFLVYSRHWIRHFIHCLRCSLKNNYTLSFCFRIWFSWRLQGELIFLWLKDLMSQ